MSVVEKTLRWIVIAGIFVTPAIALIVIDTLFFPYITGKNFAFRVVVEIISGAYLALALVLPRYRPRRSWILGAFALFVLIMAVADALGVNPFKSFWSNYERMDGWITLIHTLLLLAVAASVLTTENLWRRLFQWSLVISALLSLAGLLQVAGILTLGSGGTGLEARVDATFGNPIYFAVYMLFHVFIAALLWYQMWQVRGPGKRVAGSILYGAVIFLDTLTLLFSGTRGATLGLIVGGVLALLLYAFSGDASKRVRQTTLYTIAGLAVAGALLVAGENSSLVQRVGFLNRLASLAHITHDDTTVARVYNIETAWQGIKERPILGWGQENYAIVFDKYYDPRMYAQEQWFDRVHNIVFDWWVAGGTLGLLSYLSILAAAVWTIWKKGVFTSAERAILSGLLAAYFVHNLTVFDNITSYILFALVLGYVVYRASLATGARVISERALIGERALPIVAAASALLVWGSAWYVNAAPLAENSALIYAISPQGSPANNLALFKEAISYGTFGTQEAREQLAQISLQVINAGAGVPDDLKRQFVQLAVGELEKQAQMSPLDARFPLFEGTVLEGAGDHADAAMALQRAHQLSPSKQSILYALAQNAQLRGDAAGMLADFKQAFDLDTDDLDARLFYAAALIATGQDPEAGALLAPVIASGQAADPRITNAYTSRGEFSKLIPIWQAHVKAQPGDLQGYFTLAAVYYAAHDSADAIATLQQVEQLAPAVKTQADKYIQEIRQATLQVGR